MNNDRIREIAAEHRFIEIVPETENPGFISFIRNTSLGRIRINYYEREEIALLTITKDKKGYKNFYHTYPTHKFDLVYRLFHNSTSFKK